MKNIILSLLSLCFFTGIAAAQTNRFEANIAAFEKEDQITPVDKNVIVFTGSSSIVKWKTLKEDMTGKNVINRGFGGSNTKDLIEFADRVISAYHPKQVIIYEGDNDLKLGRMPDEVFNDFKILFQKIRAKDKGVRISFISIKPSPSRRELLANTQLTNSLISAFLKTQPKTDYIDVFNPMLNPSGQFMPKLYVADSLHMTDEGYKIWTRVVKPYVR